MLQKVNTFINQYNLLLPTSKIIVGFSGGVDSVVLLDMLTKLGHTCFAAHCNFHLRGEESDRDEHFACEYAKELDIPFYKTDFYTENYAEKEGISIEMAARKLRYKWFYSLKELLKADCIAVGHHKNDTIETFLINIIRGTGIRGVTGIKPRYKDIIRPLLCLTRKEIEQYATEKSLPFITDSTNAQEMYIRNKIRLTILPEIKKINPGVEETILKEINNFNQVFSVYQTSIQKAKRHVFDEGKMQISIDRLKSFIEPPALLYEIIHPYGFSPIVTKEIISSLDSQSGKEFFSPEYRLVKDRKHLLLSLSEKKTAQEYFIHEGTANIIEPLLLSFTSQAYSPEKEIIKDKNIAYFDLSLLTFPLQIRKWQRGDRFHPFGMKGSQKVSDYFNNNKFSILKKENTWLLCNKNDIIWIIGERINEKYRVKNTTSVMFIIKLL